MADLDGKPEGDNSMPGKVACRIEDVAVPYAYALSCISAPVPGSRQFSHVGRVVARLPTRCSVMNTCARPCLCAEDLFGADKSRGSLLASLRVAPRCPCQGWPSSGLLSLMWPQVPLSVLELLLSRKQQKHDDTSAQGPECPAGD